MADAVINDMPQAKLAFIVPVRHQDNARDWNLLKKNLTDTVRSIAAQKDGGWRGVVVANQGADLPILPQGFEVVRVDFAPNPLHEQGSADKDSFYECVRLDKGRRVLAGLLQAKPQGHVMIVDDDDFVSRHLSAFVALHPQAAGWTLADGYVWGDGSALLYKHNDFSHFCGTSHIVRADLYGASPEMAEADIKQMLGSHVMIESLLAERGEPLARLPFIGAVYRFGHAGQHSKAQTLLRHFFFKKALAKKPLEVLRRVLRLRWVTAAVRREFGL